MQQSKGGYYRGRGGGGSSVKRTNFKSGAFINNTWHCDCTPRLPASHLEVTKESVNKGRWFWTCQKPRREQCGFFLWNEDAQPREMASVLSSGRHEPNQPKEAPQNRKPAKEEIFKGKGLFATPVKKGESFGDTSSSSQHSPDARSPLKRTATQAQLDDNDDDDFALDDNDEMALAAVADSNMMQTPNKVMKTGVYATPSTTGGRTGPRKLPWLKEPTTSISSYFATPSFSDSNPPTTPTTTKTPATRKHTFPDADDDDNNQPTTPSKSSNIPLPPLDSELPSPKTPTTPHSRPIPAIPSSPSPKAKYKDALLNPADSEASLTTEVLSLLLHQSPPISLPEPKLSALRTILSRHDLRTAGVTRGRDISRVALRTKDARIAELQARVEELEREREGDKEVIRKLRSKTVQGRFG